MNTLLSSWLLLIYVLLVEKDNKHDWGTWQPWMMVQIIFKNIYTLYNYFGAFLCLNMYLYKQYGLATLHTFTDYQKHILKVRMGLKQRLIYSVAYGNILDLQGKTTKQKIQRKTSVESFLVEQSELYVEECLDAQESDALHSPASQQWNPGLSLSAQSFQRRTSALSVCQPRPLGKLCARWVGVGWTGQSISSPVA